MFSGNDLLADVPTAHAQQCASDEGAARAEASDSARAPESVTRTRHRGWVAMRATMLVGGLTMVGVMGTPAAGQSPWRMPPSVEPPAWFLESRAELSGHSEVPWRVDLEAVLDEERPTLLTPPTWLRADAPAYHTATAPTSAPPPASAAPASASPSSIAPTPAPAPHSAAMGFAPTPTIHSYDWIESDDPELVYDLRYPVPTERPWIEWGMPFYGDGIVPPGGTLFGPNNLLHPTFYVYGDFRTGVGAGRNAADSFANVAARLNLDMDLQLTSTERFHAFIGPMNNANQFTQARFDDGDLDFDLVVNPNLVTGFFEGDLGYMLGGLADRPAEFDLPIAAGLLPLLYQNGMWMEDNVTGVALSRNALHSRALNWSNYDASVFAIFDQINSPVFGADNHAAQAFGSAWFIEAYGGYIETGYAYVRDRHGLGRSYHNATIAFTRRYFDRIGNSIRVVVNTGQDLPDDQRTADGGLLILENNLITAKPMTVVPYANLFYGWGRPQSVARNALAGGILRNIGINYETDGLNGYPTLDDTGNNTAGGAAGVNLIGADLDHQWVFEVAYLHAYGLPERRIAQGDQWAVGMRYQRPLSHCTLVRFDTMYGWRENDKDLNGVRAEFRYKF